MTTPALRPSPTSAAWLAAAAASLPMGAIAAFWAMTWLIGSNGYFGWRGEALVLGNAALALLAMVAGIGLSARSAHRLRRRGRGQAFAVLAGGCWPARRGWRWSGSRIRSRSRECRELRPHRSRRARIDDAETNGKQAVETIPER